MEATRSERLWALLCSPDEAIQKQGLESVRVLGDAAVEALAAGCAALVEPYALPLSIADSR
ncbi:MAG: hypothetical protein ACI8RZ_002512 [Myxococcota bacterium]|jgi:hypothetical protein